MKKILPLSVAFLVFILILLVVIQNVMNQSAKTTPSGTMPTSITVDQRSSRTGTSGYRNLVPTTTLVTVADFKKKLPISTPDFTVDYAERLDKYVVHLQNDTAEVTYGDWLEANPQYASELDYTKTIVTKQTIRELNEALDYAKEHQVSPEQKAKKDAEILTNMLNSLVNLPYLLLNSISSTTPPEQTITTPSPTPAQQTKNEKPKNNGKSNTNNASGRGYVYYSQCSGPYDAVPLPNGCNVCQAGCGPTSVSMILASYIDSSLTPPKVIDMLDKKGVRMGCYGSYIAELYSYLEGRGDLKISDYIIPNEQKLQAKDVAACRSMGRMRVFRHFQLHPLPKNSARLRQF